MAYTMTAISQDFPIAFIARGSVRLQRLVSNVRGIISLFHGSAINPQTLIIDMSLTVTCASNVLEMNGIWGMYPAVSVLLGRWTFQNALWPFTYEVAVPLVKWIRKRFVPLCSLECTTGRLKLYQDSPYTSLVP